MCVRPERIVLARCQPLDQRVHLSSRVRSRMADMKAHLRRVVERVEAVVTADLEDPVRGEQGSHRIERQRNGVGIVKLFLVYHALTISCLSWVIKLGCAACHVGRILLRAPVATDVGQIRSAARPN